LRGILNRGKADKLLIVIEEAIITSIPGLTDEIRAYLSARASGGELVGEPVVLEGGETLKNNFAPVEKLHALIEQHGLSRHSYLAAIGGGALLDVARFGAATAHRRVR